MGIYHQYMCYLNEQAELEKLTACHPEVFTDTWKQDNIPVKHNLFLLCCYIHLGDMFRLVFKSEGDLKMSWNMSPKWM
jgi:hypothetical protein